jgi:hypothetical protein
VEKIMPATDRRVVVTASFEGQDYETFGSNEYPPPFNTTRSVILTSDNPQGLLSFQIRWGGECRAEFNTLVQRSSDNAVRIYGDLKLFEGTSENTNDLDGTTVIDFICPRSSTVPYEAFVRNTDENDDDWAKVKMTVTNFRHVVDE